MTHAGTKPAWRYFTLAFFLTALAAALAPVLGWMEGGTAAAAMATLFIVAVLGVMEVSLSFDNAVVNAAVLRGMDPVWQRRFLTWGILIAVVGMRLLFPVLIVAVAAGLGPVDTLRLAVSDPARYAAVLHGAHYSIAGFGGTYLLLVMLHHFISAEERGRWLGSLERGLAALHSISGVHLALALGVAYALSLALGEHGDELLTAAVLGAITFVGVEALGVVLGGAGSAARTGAGGFLYLEVMDTSFSLDGVIGAFALSSNLFVIALGLGVGAVYVRSMTVMLVEKGTLLRYPHLESGAYWAIAALGAIMLLGTVWDIPEVVTGLVGVTFILASLYTSRRAARRGTARREVLHAEERQ